MNLLLAVFVGGGFGSAARYLAVMQVSRVWGDAFPWGTMLVNVAGSFVAGLIVESIALKFGASPEMRALLVTGFLGGFTTFSAFSLDVWRLAEAGQYAPAAAYAGASVFLSLLAVFAGVFLARGVFGA